MWMGYTWQFSTLNTSNFLIWTNLLEVITGSNNLLCWSIISWNQYFSSLQCLVKTSTTHTGSWIISSSLWLLECSLTNPLTCFLWLKLDWKSSAAVVNKTLTEPGESILVQADFISGCIHCGIFISAIWQQVVGSHMGNKITLKWRQGKKRLRDTKHIQGKVIEKFYDWKRICKKTAPKSCCPCGVNKTMSN